MPLSLSSHFNNHHSSFHSIHPLASWWARLGVMVLVERPGMGWAGVSPSFPCRQTEAVGVGWMEVSGSICRQTHAVGVGCAGVCGELVAGGYMQPGWVSRSIPCQETESAEWARLRFGCVFFVQKILRLHRYTWCWEG